MAPTAAKKKAAASRGSLTPTSTPRVVSVVGEPIGRFAQILAETRAAGMAIEPFDITEDLVVYPPTPERVKALDQASAAHLLAQTAIVSLMQSQDPPPEDPEQRTAWAKQQQEELRSAYAQVQESEDAYNSAMFGGDDVLQRVNEFFASRPNWELVAFEKAIKEQFLRLPVDGRCQACGHEVDADAGESEGESSGGSSTSGMSSTETSPQNSTAPTPETGSEEPVLGASS